MSTYEEFLCKWTVKSLVFAGESKVLSDKITYSLKNSTGPSNKKGRLEIHFR